MGHIMQEENERKKIGLNSHAALKDGGKQGKLKKTCRKGTK